MFKPSSVDLLAFLQEAYHAQEQLDAYLEERKETGIQDFVQFPPENPIIKQEKYRTVTRYIQDADRLIRWIGQQTVLAVELEGFEKAAKISQRIRRALEDGQKPFQTWDSINKEQEVIEHSLGEPFERARKAWARVWVEGISRAEKAILESDCELAVRFLVDAVAGFVEYTNTSLIPFKIFRDHLTRQLSPVQEMFMPVESTVSPGDSGEVPASETDAAPISSGYMFQRYGNHWTVKFNAEAGLLSDQKGMSHIAKLLAQPFKPITALELMGSHSSDVAHARSVRSPKDVDDKNQKQGGAEDQPILDPQALEEYHKRTCELRGEIEKAKKLQNYVEQENLQRELDFLLEEVKKAKGLRGGMRSLGPRRENTKAKDAVRKALERAYKDIEKATHLSELLAHLKKNIQVEGASFVYRPSPVLAWKL